MYYQLKPGKDKPRVCVYVYENGKSRPIPRSITKHLDGKPEAVIEDWMRWYAAIHSIQLVQKPRLFNSDWELVLKNYHNYLESRGLYKTSIQQHIQYVRLCLPLFIDHDPDSWYLISGQLYDHLKKSNDIRPAKHNRINQYFRGFYRWMQLTNRIKHRHDLLLQNRPLETSKTPLRFVLTPDQVLDYVKKLDSPELRFVALAGYFFSLRTGEVFGARKQDFVAGKRALVFEDSRVLIEAGLDGRLVINVQSCRRPSGQLYKPSKRKLGGIVGCFNAKAANLLVELINKSTNTYIISTFTPEYWSKRWKREGIPGVTIKDLRRASLYWLGHYTTIPFVGLKNHARHRDPETTALYVRRPDEVFEGQEELDLDA